MRNHSRFVLLLLLVMVLVNIAIRYPTGSVAPHVPDTYFTIDLGRSLDEQGRANWIINELSYFGFYPLSYPSGTPFMYAEYHMLSGMSWNLVPWAFSTFFAVLMVLGGFLLFRVFRISDELSAILAGIMGLSPFFLYFTFGQGSARGFIVAISVIGLFLIFWEVGAGIRRLLLVILITFAAFSMHRSSFVIVATYLVAYFAVVFGHVRITRRAVVRVATYGVLVLGGVLLMVWPFVPGLNELLQTIPEFRSSYMVAEWEFQTGFLLTGSSPFVILVNLVANYVGSIGLLIVLFPASLMILYPKSRDSHARDVFMIVTFLFYSPMVWKAQYLQVLLLPIVYLFIGLAVQRRTRLLHVVLIPFRRFRRPSKELSKSHPKRTRARPRYTKAFAILATFLVVGTFSVGMFVHRSNMVNSLTNERDWPSDSEINVGLYLGSLRDEENKFFVSNSGFADRHIRWYSGWSSPVTDPASLQAHGYLNARPGYFVYGLREDFLGFISSFYKQQDFYTLNKSVADYELYALSWQDIYGFFRLYFKNEESPILRDTIVSCGEARISYVVEIINLGDTLSNPYLHEGSIKSRFLEEIGSGTYITYKNDMYQMFLAADPQPGGS